MRGMRAGSTMRGLLLADDDDQSTDHRATLPVSRIAPELLSLWPSNHIARGLHRRTREARVSVLLASA